MKSRGESDSMNDFRRRSTDLSIDECLKLLSERMTSHSLWENPLLKACEAGFLTQDDFRLIFGQYYFYSKNFTRCLAGLMATCESDFLRSCLSENLWEEGGETEPSKRHAEIFRRFLIDGLEIDIDRLEPIEATQLFTQDYLDFCLRSHPCEASAFLSLGTEGIVSRLYGIFMEGLRKVGVPERHLEFFHLHVECDDTHATTIQEIMRSYSHLHDWHSMCRRSMDRALDVRDRFFSNLYRHLQYSRIEPKIQKIQAKTSLAPEHLDASSYVFSPSSKGEKLYRNTVEKQNIDFTVDRVPFSCETLDPRVVRIPPGKSNELHRHAHEPIFYVMEGTGEVFLDKASFPAQAGDVVFIPRWALHQSRNLGNTEMVILAVTDDALTGRVFIGDYYRTARMKKI